jgi:uncharacterized iron-regulated protein
MSKITAFVILIIISVLGFGQDKVAYTIFDSNGKRVSYRKMIKALNEKDVVLFGEYHDNPIVHWLQFEVTIELDKKRDLVLAAEMFEADNQDELDDYIAGKIDAKAFDTLARLWPNYYTDYAPLVEYARENELKFVAANIPRRYANYVFKGGFERLDSLTDEEKSWMAPLPMKYDSTLPGYVKMIGMMGGHGGSNMPKAQATKDATMAHFILKNHKEGGLSLHFNGSFHSDFYDGILWYLKQERPELNYGTISTVSQSDVFKLEDEYKGQADFIICVHENMTSTH